MNSQKINIDYSKERKYSGYRLFNMIFFTLIATPTFALILNFSSRGKLPFRLLLIVILIWCLIFFLIGVKRYNYFIINNKTLIVKNIFWPYKNISIHIDVIQEANIQMKSGGKAGIMVLELRRKDLTLETYWSDSLTDKNWRDLRNDLMHFGIQVNVIDTYIGRLD